MKGLGGGFFEKRIPRGVLLVCFLGAAISLLSGAESKPETPEARESPAADLPPYKRLLTGEDAKRVEELEKKIEELEKLCDFRKAAEMAKEILQVRTRVQGEGHWEVVDARWKATSLRRLDRGTPQERTEYAEAQELLEEAEALEKKNLRQKAQSLFERRVEIVERIFGAEHVLTAQSYNGLASNLYSQGKYSEAQPLFARELALHKKLHGEEHLLTALNYNNLAWTLSSQEKYGEAQSLFEEALALYRKLRGEEHPDTAQSYNNLAANLHSQGKYREAQPFFERELALLKKLCGEEHVLTAQGYNNIAVNLSSQGKYGEAQALHERALALREKTVGEDHLDTAQSYNNLAANLDLQGKRAEAQVLHEKALTIRKECLGEEHFDTLVSYNNLAVNLYSQGKYAAAQVLQEKVLALRKKLLGEAHSYTASSCNNLALTLISQGRYREAQALLEKALAAWIKVMGEEHPETAKGYGNLARDLKAQGKYAEAQVLEEKVLAFCEKFLGEEHPDTVLTCSTLAKDFYSQGEYPKALRFSKRAASAFSNARLRVAATGLDRTAFSGRGSPYPLLSALLARLGQPREAWRQLEAGLGRGLFDDLSARDARKLSDEDRSRERKLLSEISSLEAALAAPSEGQADSPERKRKLESLRQRHLELTAELSAFTHELEKKYGVAEGTVFDLEGIQAQLPEDAALVGWVDVQGERHAADPNGEHWAVVVRAKGEPAWVRLPGSGPRGEWLQEDDSIGQRLAERLGDDKHLSEGLPQELLSRLHAQRLRPIESLLENWQGLPSARRLIVLPSAALRGVPLAVLSEKYTVSHAPSGTVFAWLREKRRGKETAPKPSLLAVGDPVLRSPDLARQSEPSKEPELPDHGVLATLVTKDSNAERSGIRSGDVLLSYGGERIADTAALSAAIQKGSGTPELPVSVWREGETVSLTVKPGTLGVNLDKRGAREAIIAERQFAKLLRTVRDGTESYAEIPGTRREVQAIAGVFAAAGGRVKELLGSEASEQRLADLRERGQLSTYRYLHFATHGVLNLERSFDSALILSRDRLPDPVEAVLAGTKVVDGRLTAGEIRRTWELDADLVVLSACQTAMGRYTHGEGYLGFAQALLLSGARSVVLSLWKVDDTATALLMTRLYENLLGGRAGLKSPMPKAEALGEAQGWLRELRRSDLDVLVEGLALSARGEERPLRVSTPKKTPEGQPVKKPGDERPYAHPYYWAAFILVGDPD